MRSRAAVHAVDARVTADCELPRFSRALSIVSRENTNNQSERRIPPAPISTSERSSRLGGQMGILFTQPCATSLPARIA